MTLYNPGRPSIIRPLESGKRPHSVRGEYRIIDKNTNQIMYIGVSKALNRHMREHIKSGKINEQNAIFAYKTADGRASQEKLNDHERKKILQHNPEFNQRAGGAVNSEISQLHTSSESEFAEFIKGYYHICSHNILAHDLKYIEYAVNNSVTNSRKYVIMNV